jgi:hypothetical protein
MGTPDYCHFGDRCYEVKCFGKNSTFYVPGDKVQLFRNCHDMSVFRRFDEAERLQKAYRKRRGFDDPVDKFFKDWEESEAKGVGENASPAIAPEIEVPDLESFKAPWTPWDKIIPELWHQAHSGDPVELASYQIITRDGEYIVVLGDHLSHWQATPLSHLPTFNNVGEVSEDASEGAYPASFSEECEVCLVLQEDATHKAESKD